MHEILLYYKYTTIENPEQFRLEQIALCEKLNLSGRIIVATEGLNGTVEGTPENTQKYIDIMLSDERFKDMNFKRSAGTGNAFPRLSVKVRREIVSLHLDTEDFSPTQTTGKYLAAEDLHEWIHSGKEFYIIDMRNDYEHKIGHFENSILPAMRNFRDLPKVLPTLEHLKNKTIVTVCTGGVRCEKASGFLIKHGFNDVYQLHNGIVTYMEKYPEEDFKGQLYVFDGRIAMAFNNPSVEHTVIGRCDKCNTPSERYVNCSLKSCNAHFICCDSCQEKSGAVFCSTLCMVRSHLKLTLNRFKTWFART